MKIVTVLFVETVLVLDTAIGNDMAVGALEAGKRWVEQRFQEIALVFGAIGYVAKEDRWREAREPFRNLTYCMAYYLEVGGHVKHGELTFWDVHLKAAGAGDTGAREKIESHIRYVLGSYRSKLR